MLQLGSGVPSASILFPLTKIFYHLHFYYLMAEIETFNLSHWELLYYLQCTWHCA